MGYIALVAVAGITWLLFKRNPEVVMPAIGNSAVVHIGEAKGGGAATVQFIQKGAGFGWEPFEFSGPKNVRIPVNGNDFWHSGEKRRIPANINAGLYAWQPGLNMFTLLPEN